MLGHIASTWGLEGCTVLGALQPSEVPVSTSLIPQKRKPNSGEVQEFSSITLHRASDWNPSVQAPAPGLLCAVPQVMTTSLVGHGRGIG